MSESLPIPDRAVLEDDVRRLLELARKRSGATVTEMVDALGALQARGAGSRRSWYDWQERPETVSSLTTLGALHVLGPGTAMELLFGKRDGIPASPSETEQPAPEHMAELQAQIATLAELVHGLQEAMEMVQEQMLQAGIRRTEPSAAGETARTPT